MSDMNFTRYRFWTDSDDPRPVLWPPPGPYWITGTDTRERTSIVAYLPAGADLLNYWPEAEVVSAQPRREVEYSDRFERPPWYEGLPQS